jgi:methylmalonyl-CoA mutase N-terminal domain/subunit
VIAFESGVADIADPLGGAYALEAATDQLEAEALGLIERIERAGGALVAIERGEIQRQIHESAYRFQRQVEAGERVLVGVNRFEEHDEPPAQDILRIDPDGERRQVERVRALRARRPAAAWQAALVALGDTARGGGNLTPPILAAVEAWATVGEIAAVLREVFGEHREVLVL